MTIGTRHSALDPPAPVSARPAESRDPATGEVWRAYRSAGAAEVEGAVAAARAAQPAWAARPARERARVLERFRRALYRRRAEVARLIERESGKPAAEAMAADVAVVLDLARFYARRAPRLLRRESLTPHNIAFWRKRVHITHEPLGVIGVIAPWNYPLMLPAGSVLAALVAGNGVVLKPSEFTPATGLVIGELLAEAGAPAGLMHVVVGGGDTGAALVASGVDKLFFTGSAATGRRVAMACAERMLPYVLELGGSDPAIVLEDADLATAASGILWGRFSNAGQTCVAPKRVLVVDAIFDRFVERLRAAAESLRVGPDAPHDVGPLIRPWQVEQLESQLEDAVARGARVLTGGSRVGESFFRPTVLADVTPAMRVMSEETFGPLLPVVRVRDAEAAVEAANASSFGLSASVWTRDAARGAALAARLHAGTVMVNDAISVVGVAEVPHGGVKESGTGRTHGEAGLLECVRSKSVVVDRLASMRQPWWFGYGDEHAANIDAFVRFWHGDGLAARLSGLPRSLRMMFKHERPL